ncbi:MAG TPA: hypothetical protein VJ732_03025 [Bryobacteraceae bacterium]|nr:hypothetical protein [Bryobacteraceae bacterium]
MRFAAIPTILLVATSAAFSQSASVRAAAPLNMPAPVDSNSPGYWMNGDFHLLNSTGNGPMRADGTNQNRLGVPESVRINRIHPWPTWIEAVWVDSNGIIFAWYHQEQPSGCPGRSLAVPHIGEAISYDGGNSFQDMGTIISSPVAPDCQSQNGYFAGGNGDVSVIRDQNSEYFYFLFTNYAGPKSHQGIALARMPFASRYNPVGAVQKYFQGDFTEPGENGRVTAIFPAKVRWEQPNADSFWGPSIHWNTYLNSYVMLLNHSCCTPGFPQEGIYVTFGADLSNPASWTAPVKLMDNSGWYPQVLGGGKDGSDTLAGRTPRLYIYGQSQWQIVFDKASAAAPLNPQQPSAP